MNLVIRDTDEVLQTPDKEKARKLGKLIAEEYKERLRQAVINQSRASQWAPLNKAYREHKIRTGLNPGMWIATSKLIESIVVIDKSGRIEIGVDRRKKHNGTPLTTIVRALEYGTKTIPPRPLFRPIRKELVREVPQLVEKYREEGKL